MKYFLDTEFLEGTQKTLFGKTKPTIDLISIGIVAEDGREYYAISKDFNLKEAWNRYDVKSMTNLAGDTGTNKMKVYWIRENVLKPIFKDLNKLNNGVKSRDYNYEEPFLYNNFKKLLDKYGKSNKQIAEEIKEYIYPKMLGMDATDFYLEKRPEIYKPEFYGYYADYDWVVFCWLFGRMIDLPNGFPMYCRDLKQIADEIYNKRKKEYNERKARGIEEHYFISKLNNHPNYPKQTNKHNALADAEWNKELYEFLNTL